MITAILFYVALPFALFYFFSYASFDYTKLEPPSRGAVLFQVILCLIPLLLVNSQNQKLVQTISALAATAIVSAAVLIDVPPPPSRTVSEWFSQNTIGRAASKAVENYFLSALFFAAHVIGVNWLYGLVCMAGILAIGKNIALRLQPETLPRNATPSLWRMICVYGIVFSWMAEIVERADLNRYNWHRDWTDIAYGLAAGALLQRLPVLSKFGVRSD